MKTELSKSQWAAALGISRETVGRGFDLAGVTPSGTRRGHAVYALKDGLRALARYVRPDGEGPDAMPPHQAHQYWKAQHEELKVRQLAGELCLREDARRALTEQAKTFVLMAETLPDRLERDGGLPPHAIALTERIVDEFRVETYRQLTESQPTGPESTTAPKEHHDQA